MSVIAPQTDVYLLKVPLEIDNTNQLTFSDANTQHAYFNSLPKLSFDQFTYQRKDGTLRIPALIDDIIQYNYVMYRNEGFSNKWFYAFIDKMEYLNDSVTAVSISTDIWQTWCFDLTYKPTFVEREHVNNDTVGLHTIPEGLECGEYVVNGSIINSVLNSASTESNVTWICFQVSDYPDGNGALSPTLGDDVDGKFYGGVYSGLSYLLVLTAGDANDLIKCYDLANKADAIVSIFQVPFGAINSEHISITNHTPPFGGNIGIGRLSSDMSPIEIDSITLSKPTSLNGYIPKNNKMLTYPFSYFYCSNNAGIESEFRWEDFSSNPAFKIDGVISQGMSIKAYPTNYKNSTNLGGYNFGITCGKLPVCAWNSDYYVNWCTQNAVNIPLSIASSVVNTGLGVVTSAKSGNVLGGISSLASGIEKIGEVISQSYQAKITPDQAKGNTNCGDINIAEKRFGFTFYPMSIKAEYASMCDQFMSMFGYKVNTVKTPNITGRRNWNYVKTVGCYIEADIPQDDLQGIKDMFNNGVTFWHNPSTFADYGQNNDII